MQRGTLCVAERGEEEVAEAMTVERRGTWGTWGISERRGWRTPVAFSVRREGKTGSHRGDISENGTPIVRGKNL